MKKEAYVLNIEGEDNILVFHEEEPQDLMGWELDESREAVEVLEDDPQLTQEILNIDPKADAFERIQSISIH